MSMDPPTSSPVKGTGIPRFSRLPTPKPVTLTAIVAERDNTNRSPSKVGSISGRPSISAAATASKPGIPRLDSTSRCSSIAPPGSIAPRPASVQSRRPVSPLKSSSSRLNTGTARPSSRAQSPSKAASNTRGEDVNDRLGSLDGFRSASRQGFHEPAPTSRQSPDDTVTPKVKQSSRLSLSDRTIESIFQAPSTPSTDRRRSSFFAPESPMVQSPMRPPSRPISALSVAKRPLTSDGTLSKHGLRPASPVKRAGLGIQHESTTSVDYSRPTPSRRTVSASLQRPCSSSITPRPSASTTKPNFSASISSASRSSIRPPAVKSSVARPNSRLAPRSAMAQSGTVTSTPSTRPIPQLDGTSDSPSSFTKSSAALRDQIAKAKNAAKRSATVKHDSLVGKGDFDLNTDPFNQRPKGDNTGLLRKRIESARMDGRLDISSIGLLALPNEVLKMYDPESMKDSKISWNEIVDPIRLIAADNDLESLSEEAFPDIDPGKAAESEEDVNFQFIGLEMIDLHANRLNALPLGLRRLERLTSLNLSHNKLGVATIETICQIPSLKDLKLAHNSISGYLPPSITKLCNLEVLELQENKLLSLPECLRELTHLRVLNVSGNQLTGLPMDALEPLPIADLDVSSNALVGALFPFSVSGMTSLRNLNVANNSLVSLAFSENLHLPAIQTITIAHNRIVSIPDMSGWTSLITLGAEGNKISAIPAGFTSLKHIKHADFSSNELTRLDESISSMENLDRLLLGANPLRERKLLSMSTEQLKADLKARLAPAPSEHTPKLASAPFVDEPVDIQSPGVVPSPWKLGTEGALDLSGKSLTDNHGDYLRSFLGVNNVRELQLSSNLFTMIPFELPLAQQLRLLDMSMCSLGDGFMDEAMALPTLQELVLSGNKMTSLDPLLVHLHAPCLQHLDVSNNKLSGTLPVLRDTFTELVHVYASDNRIESVTAKSLKGLHTAVLARNNIMHVPPGIGLLWYEGLRGLDIGSNAFRVPSYRILEKGTESTLTWLRDRIPGHVEDESETF